MASSSHPKELTSEGAEATRSVYCPELDFFFSSLFPLKTLLAFWHSLNSQAHNPITPTPHLSAPCLFPSRKAPLGLTVGRVPQLCVRCAELRRWGRNSGRECMSQRSCPPRQHTLVSAVLHTLLPRIPKRSTLLSWQLSGGASVGAVGL